MAQKGKTGLLRNCGELGSRKKGVMARNTRTGKVKPTEALPHGMGTQFQSNAMLEQTEMEGLALLTVLEQHSHLDAEVRLMLRPISKTIPATCFMPWSGKFHLSCKSQVYSDSTY